VFDPDWVPLLRPTPSHQDYVSTHAIFGAAGAAVLKNFNGGDEIDASFSSNVTLDGQGVITRHFTSLEQAAYENARSRIFGGVSVVSQAFLLANAKHFPDSFHICGRRWPRARICNCGEDFGAL
jgi:hypothetical protein